MLCEEKDYLLGEYGVVHCTKPDLERSALPKGREVSPVTMEELFIYMSKEAE